VAVVEGRRDVFHQAAAAMEGELTGGGLRHAKSLRCLALSVKRIRVVQPRGCNAVLVN
jgi:hypothetical protein